VLLWCDELSATHIDQKSYDAASTLDLGQQLLTLFIWCRRLWAGGRHDMPRTSSLRGAEAPRAAKQMAT